MLGWARALALCACARAASPLVRYRRYVARLASMLQGESEEYAQFKQVLHFPYTGLTMQTKSNLQALRSQLEDIVDRNVDGDIYELGSWRGGTSIFMAGVLNEYERLKGKHNHSTKRHSWVFDSFQGFSDQHITEVPELGDPIIYHIPLDITRLSFLRYGLMSDRVTFVKGFFEDTVPRHDAPGSIAVLRLDGDMYSSTYVALMHLYPKVALGGWVIIDDYDWRPRDVSPDTMLCREAVDDYRREHGIVTPLVNLSGIWSWIKS